MNRFPWILVGAVLWSLWTPVAAQAQGPGPSHALRTNDVIALLGGGTAEARARGAHWETLLMATHPGHRLRVLNLAREGDTVFSQLRDVNYPAPLRQVAEAKATICVLDFGQGEAFAGMDRLDAFAERLDQWVVDLQGMGVRVVLATPAPVVRPDPPPVEAYAEGIRRIARRRNLALLDVFEAARGRRGLSEDGRRLSDAGHARIAAAALGPWLGGRAVPPVDEAGRFREPSWEALRQALVERNTLWKGYTRPTNWAFLAGDRTEQPSSRDHRDPKVRWFPAEMEQFVPLLQAADRKADALAALATALPTANTR
ncbi:MAG: GDSL-type esterase/lipase family protein [Verrucomicrobiota bacterium]